MNDGFIAIIVHSICPKIPILDQMNIQGLSVERMRIEDYEELHNLWSDSPGVTLRAVDDSREGIERFLRRNPNNSFICRLDKIIIGGILSGHDGRKGFIYHTVVKDNYQGSGIGKVLVANVINSLRKEHITKIGVLVNSDNHSGNDFWGSLGFSNCSDLNYRLLPLNDLNI